MDKFFDCYEEAMAAHLADTPTGPYDRLEIAAAAAYNSAIRDEAAAGRIVDCWRDLVRQFDELAKQLGLSSPPE